MHPQSSNPSLAWMSDKTFLPLKQCQDEQTLWIIRKSFFNDEISHLISTKQSMLYN